VAGLVPLAFDWGILIYEIIQVAVAFIAVMLALKWKKNDFLPGLFFLFVYTVLDAIDIFVFSMIHEIYIDVAQFGFVLLAIVFFIIGMNPSWVHERVSRWKHPWSQW
jgi:F0F1-type ATP synthase membrane subunit a